MTPPTRKFPILNRPKKNVSQLYGITPYLFEPEYLSSEEQNVDCSDKKHKEDCGTSTWGDDRTGTKYGCDCEGYEVMPTSSESRLYKEIATMRIEIDENGRWTIHKYYDWMLLRYYALKMFFVIKISQILTWIRLGDNIICCWHYPECLTKTDSTELNTYSRTSYNIIVGFELVEVAIFNNSKPTKYRNLYENKATADTANVIDKLQFWPVIS